MRLRFGLGRRYGWPLYRCLAFALWGGERMLSDGRPLNVLEQFERRFPGRCAICSYHRYGVTHGHVAPGVPVDAHEGCPEGRGRTANA